MQKKQKPTEEFDFQKQVKSAVRDMPVHKDFFAKYRSFSLTEDDYYRLNNLRIERNLIHLNLPQFGQQLMKKAAEDHKLFNKSFCGISKNELAKSNLAQVKDSIEKLFNKFEKVEF